MNIVSLVVVRFTLERNDNMYRSICVSFWLKYLSLKKNLHFFEYIGFIGQIPEKEDIIGLFLKI
jgi:hypothetical protein